MRGAQRLQGGRAPSRPAPNAAYFEPLALASGFEEQRKTRKRPDASAYGSSADSPKSCSIELAGLRRNSRLSEGSLDVVLHQNDQGPNPDAFTNATAAETRDAGKH